MAELGILSSKLEGILAEQLDKLVVLKGILEAVDGTAFKLVISVIDNNLAERIPEPFKSTLAGLLIDIFEETDYNKAALKAAEFVDGLVDIPGLDDTTEKQIFISIFTIVASLFVKPNTDKQ
jgi:hypothetical protein